MYQIVLYIVECINSKTHFNGPPCVVHCTRFINWGTTFIFVFHLYSLMYKIQTHMASQVVLYFQIYYRFFLANLKFCKDCPSNKLTWVHEINCYALFTWFLELTYICTLRFKGIMSTILNNKGGRRLQQQAAFFYFAVQLKTFCCQTWNLSKDLQDRRFQGKKFTQKTRNFRHLLNLDKKCVNALN